MRVFVLKIYLFPADGIRFRANWSEEHSTLNASACYFKADCFGNKFCEQNLSLSSFAAATVLIEISGYVKGQGEGRDYRQLHKGQMGFGF
jgi:hypothetical protein